MFVRHLASVLLFAVVSGACSGTQNLGSSGKSKAGETCSKSGDCADGLACLNQRCGGGGGSDFSVPGGASSTGAVLSCTSDAACAGAGALEPYCKDGGACVQCLADAHCANNAMGTHCKVTPSNQTPNTCVACLADGDCTDPNKPRCATGESGNFCEECLADADCKDPTRSHCHVTQTGTDAPFGYCEHVAGDPTESCASDEACAKVTSFWPYCKDGGTCTQCLRDEHCAKQGSPPFCKVTPSNQDQNTCVECLADKDCTDPRRAHCSTGENGNNCVACLADTDCKDAATPRCKVTQTSPKWAADGICVGCLQNADCKDPASPICRNDFCSMP